MKTRTARMVNAVPVVEHGRHNLGEACRLAAYSPRQVLGLGRAPRQRHVQITETGIA